MHSFQPTYNSRIIQGVLILLHGNKHLPFFGVPEERLLVFLLWFISGHIFFICSFIYWLNYVFFYIKYFRSTDDFQKTFLHILRWLFNVCPYLLKQFITPTELCTEKFFPNQVCRGSYFWEGTPLPQLLFKSKTFSWH